VGVLAHFMEEQGIPTAGISLVRPHTETIKPPRSLWVPFELGRPLGVPDDTAFQRRVMLSLLKLFEATEGPILEDFPEDAPASDDDIHILSCPLYIDEPGVEPSESDPLQTKFFREIKAMRPWYDMALKKRNRTTVGASGIELDSVGDFIYGFIEGSKTIPPLPSVES